MTCQRAFRLITFSKALESFTRVVAIAKIQLHQIRHESSLLQVHLCRKWLHFACLDEGEKFWLWPQSPPVGLSRVSGLLCDEYVPWQERHFIIVIICSYCLAFLWREFVQQTSLWNHLVYLDRVIWTLTMRGIWEEDARWYFWPHLAVLTLQMNSSRMILRGGKKV